MSLDDTARKPRADALRNRERLIDTAKAAFAEVGSEVSLDEIARRAGVGIGTLYRHFPTRDAIVEAVYRREVAQIAEAAERLVQTRPPLDALREWLRLFVDYMATKRVIAPALAAMVGGTSELFAASGEQFRTAVGRLVDAAQTEGAIREDVEAADIMQALAGLTYGASAPDWATRALRLIDIMMDGLRR